MNAPAIITSQQISDAVQAAFPFVVAQGINIETTVYARRYPAFNYAAHVPVVTEGDAWSYGTMFYTTDYTGEAKWLSGAANDMPFNQVVRDQAMTGFYMLGSGWEWNIEEVQQAIRMGIALNDAKAMATSMTIERMLNGVALTGSVEKGMTGLINSPLVPRSDAAAIGSGSSTYWANKDENAILADVNIALSKVQTQTGEVEYADTLRIPPNAFRDLATRRLGTANGNMTVLEYLRANNVYTAQTGQPLDIAVLRELGKASAAGGGRLMAYRKSPEVVRFHLPMPRTVLPPRQKSLMGFEQGMIARTGGTEWRLPLAASYIDEITAVPA